jgi:hypothetical protein
MQVVFAFGDTGGVGFIVAPRKLPGIKILIIKNQHTEGAFIAVIRPEQ